MKHLVLWCKGLLWRFKWPAGLVLLMVIYSFLDNDLTHYKQIVIGVLLNPASKFFCVCLVAFDYLYQMKDSEVNFLSSEWLHKAITKLIPPGFFWLSMYFVKYGFLSLFGISPFHLPFDVKTHLALISFSGQFFVTQLNPMWQYAVGEYKAHQISLKSPQVHSAPNSINEKESNSSSIKEA